VEVEKSIGVYKDMKHADERFAEDLWQNGIDVKDCLDEKRLTVQIIIKSHENAE
jgi:hypothetical protein